jgi:hypothetical protein
LLFPSFQMIGCNLRVAIVVKRRFDETISQMLVCLQVTKDIVNKRRLDGLCYKYEMDS